MTLPVLALLLAVGGDPIDDGQARYDSGDFEGAIRVAGRAVPVEADPLRRAQLRVLQARSALALRRQLDVESALEAALGDDPTLTVDPGTVGPAFAATLERLRLTLAGSVSIASNPTGLAVRVDGALVGQAPRTERLSVGRHRLAALDPSGAEGASADVVVHPRAEQRVDLELRTARPAPPPVPVPAPAPAGVEQAPGWAPAAAVHAVIDPRAGVAVEGGLVALGRHWLVEVDGISGRVAGVGARAGGRLNLVTDRLDAQLTADGTLFFASSVAPGGGVSAGLTLRLLSWIDVFAQGRAMFFRHGAPYRSSYALVDAGLRLFWPGWGAP